MNANKWIKTSIFGGRQIVWSVERKNISIVRDNRESRKDDNYPYRVEVDGEYKGDYNKLSIAKKDALIYHDLNHKNDPACPLYEN